MPDFDLSAFEERLGKSGVARRQIRLASLEVRDHLNELYADARERGLDDEQAQRWASKQFGDLRALAAGFAARPELKSWVCRYPRVALVCLPLAYAAMLPTAPIFAGVAHASDIARWFACFALGAAITATTFLLLQISIALG